MRILAPRDVSFGSVVCKDVDAITINRAAQRQVVEWSDAGPHAVFADVPQQQVTVRLEQRVSAEIDDVPKPGDTATLSFQIVPGGDARRRRISAACTVVSVRHEMNAGKGAARLIDFVAVSSDGVADPVTIESIGVAP